MNNYNIKLYESNKPIKKLKGSKTTESAKTSKTTKSTEKAESAKTSKSTEKAESSKTSKSIVSNKKSIIKIVDDNAISNDNKKVKTKSK